MKDISVKNWSSIPGSGPVPWREAPSWFNNNTAPGGLDGLCAYERVPHCFLEKNKTWESSGLINGSLKTDRLEMIENEVLGISL